MIKELSLKHSNDLALYQKAVDSIRSKRSFRLEQYDKTSANDKSKDMQEQKLNQSRNLQKEGKQKVHKGQKLGVSHQMKPSSSIEQRNLSQSSNKKIFSFLSVSHSNQLSVSRSKRAIYIRRNQQREKTADERIFKTQHCVIESPVNRMKVFYLSINRTPFNKKSSKSQDIYYLPNFDDKNPSQNKRHRASSTMRYLEEYLSKISNKKIEKNQSPSQRKRQSSIIPAFPKQVKYRTNNKQKKDCVFDNIHNYALTNKMKEIQKSLIVLCKKQEIILSSPQKNKEDYFKRDIKKSTETKSKHFPQGRSKNKQMANHNKAKMAAYKPLLNLKRKEMRIQKDFQYFSNNPNLNIYQIKMKLYRQLIFIVNMAHRVFDPITIYQTTSKEKKYCYYIGPGNNSKLIKALMKRRPWWHQCNNIKDAHFVWTQIKVGQIFQSQPQRHEQIQVRRQSQQKTKQMQGGSIQLINFNLSKQFIFKPPFAHHRQSKILLPYEASVYRELLSCLRHSEFDSFQSRLKHLPESFMKIQGYSKDITLHNHLQMNQSLGNKKSLFYHLSLYYKITGKSAHAAFPQTYHVKSLENDENFKQFALQFQKLSKKKSINNVWIVKPGENSNRGNGIEVFNDIRRLKYSIRDQKYKDGMPKTYIIQKYIERPLLYQGRKFDIRHYMIVTTLYGHLRAYWYGEGYIRTSSYPFNLDELEDSMVHLTNDAIQKKSKEYGNHQQGNKISYIDLQRYFDKNYPFKNFDFKKIYVKMRNLGRDSIAATYLTLTQSRKMHNFQIFGLDFMVDDHLKVHLIQINTNPCLQISCPILGRIIPLMVEQTLRVSLDVIFPPNIHFNNNLKSLAPDCSLQKLNMELIFDQVQERQTLLSLYSNHREQYKQMMGILSGSQGDEQTFDNQGDELQLDKFII